MKNLGKLSTVEDFISFYFDQLQTQLNSANINLSKSGFIGFFLNLLGNFQFDIKNYLDGLFNEAFPVTAIDNDNLIYHSNLFGFLPGFATAATLAGNIRFDFNEIPVIPSNVDRREIFLSDITFIAEDIFYTLETSYKIIITRISSVLNYQVQITDKDNNQTFISFDINNPIVKLDGAVQFQKENISFTTPNYVFGSHFSQEFDLEDSSLSNITADVDSEIYDIQLTKNFVDSGSKTLFLKILSDTKILIEVGSGIHGKYIPNKTVNLVFLKSKGSKGNIASQDIRNASGSLNILDFDSNNNLLTNTVFTDVSKFLTFEITKGENGKDILKGENLRTELLSFIQSRTNLISESDFENILSSFFNHFQLLFKKTSLVDNIINLYTELDDDQSVPVYTRTTSVLKNDLDLKLLNPEFTIDNKTFISPFLYKFNSLFNLYEASIVKKDPIFFPFKSENILTNSTLNPNPIFLQLIFDGTDTVVNVKSFQDITSFTVSISVPILSITDQNMILDSANNLFAITLSNKFFSEKSSIVVTFNDGTNDIFEYKFKDVQHIIDISDILSLKKYDKDTFSPTLPVFTGGSGQNDLTVSGNFTTTAITNYRVEIDTAPTGSIASFSVLESSSITAFSKSIFDSNNTTITTPSHTLNVNDKVLISSTTKYNGIFTVKKVNGPTSFDIDTFFSFDEQTGTWQKSPDKTLVIAFASNLSNLETVSITNTVNYNGIYIIEDAQANSFVITKKFVSNENGTWESTNKFRWSNDGGTTFSASNIPITSSTQLLENGVSIQFQNKLGHLLTHSTIPVFSGSSSLTGLTVSGIFTASSPITYLIQIDTASTTDTFKWSKDNGQTFINTTVGITGTAQFLDNGISITFADTTGHQVNDSWTFTSYPNDRWDFIITNESILDIPLIDKTTYNSDDTFFSNLLINTLGSIALKDNRMISDNVQTRFLNSHFISSTILTLLTLQKHTFNLTLPLKLNISLILDKNRIIRDRINVNDRIDQLKDNIADFVFKKHTGREVSFFRTALIDLIMNDEMVTSATVRMFDSSGSVLSAITFTGDTNSLNDLTLSGTFTGLDTLNYQVEIDSASTPNTFRWSDDGGVTYKANQLPITGFSQLLNNGISVTFSSTTGHNAQDIFGLIFTGSGNNDLTFSGTFTGTSKIDYRVIIDGLGSGGSPDTFKWSKDKGRTFIATTVPLTLNTPILLDNGVNVNFSATTGHKLSTITQPTFTGATNVPGNVTTSGTFDLEEALNYRVEIDGVGVGANTFRWSDSGGLIYNASNVAVASALSPLLLNNGVSIQFSQDAAAFRVAAITTVTKNGTGTINATSGGIYTGLSIKNFHVEIETVLTKTITGYSDSVINPGTETTVSSVGHGLLSGDMINITGSSDATYNNQYTISNVTSNTFDIPVAFNTNPSDGSWEKNNTFKWSNNDGMSFVATGIKVDTTAQLLEDGVTITFSSAFGGILGDNFKFTATPADRWDFTATPADRWDFSATPADRWDFTAISSQEIPDADIKSIDQKEVISTLTKNDLIDFSPIFWYWDLNNIIINFSLV